jgi:hypothetical protein
VLHLFVMLSTNQWLLFNTKWAIFQPYHGEKKLHSMRWRWCLLCTRPTFSWNLIVLVHLNNCVRIDMLLHSETLSWFQANQSLFLLLNAVCLAENCLSPCMSTYYSVDETWFILKSITFRVSSLVQHNNWDLSEKIIKPLK